MLTSSSPDTIQLLHVTLKKHLHYTLTFVTLYTTTWHFCALHMYNTSALYSACTVHIMCVHSFTPVPCSSVLENRSTFDTTNRKKLNCKPNVCFSILRFVPLLIDFKMFSLKKHCVFFFLHLLAYTTTKAPTPVPTCPPNWINCNNTSICIKTEWLCDGVVNCPGYWDELPKNCPSMLLVKCLGISLKLLVWERLHIRIVSKFRELSSDGPTVIVTSAYNVEGILLREGANLWESFCF